MVEELDETMKSIIQCIIDNTNFKLEAAAGAGKTYSLIETLKYIKKYCNITFFLFFHILQKIAKTYLRK